MEILAGFDPDRLDQMDQATIMQLIALQASKKKDEGKEELSGIVVDEEEHVIPVKDVPRAGTMPWMCCIPTDISDQRGVQWPTGGL